MHVVGALHALSARVADPTAQAVAIRGTLDAYVGARIANRAVGALRAPPTLDAAPVNGFADAHGAVVITAALHATRLNAATGGTIGVFGAVDAAPAGVTDAVGAVLGSPALGAAPAGRIAHPDRAVGVHQALPAKPRVLTGGGRRTPARHAGLHALASQRIADLAGPTCRVATGQPWGTLAIDEALPLGARIARRALHAVDVAGEATDLVDAAIPGASALGVSAAGRAGRSAERLAGTGLCAVLARVASHGSAVVCGAADAGAADLGRDALRIVIAGAVGVAAPPGEQVAHATGALQIAGAAGRRVSSDARVDQAHRLGVIAGPADKDQPQTPDASHRRRRRAKRARPTHHTASLGAPGR